MQQEATCKGKAVLLFFLSHPWLFGHWIVPIWLGNGSICFITNQNFSTPSLSVLHSSSILSMLLQSASAKYRRPIKAFISVLPLSLASLSWLELGWIIGICWFVCWTVLYQISSVVRQLHASEGIVAFRAWPVTTGSFARIFYHKC